MMNLNLNRFALSAFAPYVLTEVFPEIHKVLSVVQSSIHELQ